MIPANLLFPNVGRSFYDKTVTHIDKNKDFLSKNQEEATGLAPRLHIPKFIELVGGTPNALRYENGDPVFNPHEYAITPYGVMPKRKKSKPSDETSKSDQTNTENTDPDQTETTSKNNFVAVMCRRKHLHMTLIILLLLIIIIILLKR